MLIIFLFTLNWLYRQRVKKGINVINNFKTATTINRLLSLVLKECIDVWITKPIKGLTCVVTTVFVLL